MRLRDKAEDHRALNSSQTPRLYIPKVGKFSRMEMGFWFRSEIIVRRGKVFRTEKVKLRPEGISIRYRASKKEYRTVYILA